MNYFNLGVFMKRGLILLSLACLGSLSASEVAYTQNNLPMQHKQRDQYPLIFNADVLLGKLSVQGMAPLRLVSTNNTAAADKRFDLPNQAEIGVRAGIGVGLRNDFNLSLQWTYLRSGERSHKVFDLTNVNQMQQLSVELVEDAALYQTPDTVSYKAQTKYSMHWLDLLIQTSSWMLSSHLRFQPFGGLRYFYFKFFRETTSSSQVQPDTQFAKVVDKIHATGALVGTDIKFLIQKWLHFYTNIYAGLIAGQNDQVTSSIDTNTTTLINQSFAYRLDFCPFINVQFGIATQFQLWKDSLLSMRIFYELFSMSTKLLNPTGIRSRSINQPLAYIKTQVGGLGLTVVF